MIDVSTRTGLPQPFCVNVTLPRTGPPFGSVRTANALNGFGFWMKWKWLLNGWNRWQFVSVEIVTSANAQTEINNITPTTWVHILLLLLLILKTINDCRLQWNCINRPLKKYCKVNVKRINILNWFCCLQTHVVCCDCVCDMSSVCWWRSHGAHIHTSHTRYDKVNDIAFVIGQNDKNL